MQLNGSSDYPERELIRIKTLADLVLLSEMSQLAGGMMPLTAGNRIPQAVEGVNLKSLLLSRKEGELESKGKFTKFTDLMLVIGLQTRLQ